MRFYLGVDPGKAGAVAVLGPAGELLELQPVPIVHSARARDEYDLPGIVDMLERYRDGFVTVEKLQPLPAKLGGTIANYNRGVAAGWAWMLAALRIPYQLVRPQAWQREMLAGLPGEDTGQRSILAAQRLFPSADLRRTERCRKLDDGLSDALLICEWGRRQHQGRAAQAAPGGAIARPDNPEAEAGAIVRPAGAERVAGA